MTQQTLDKLQTFTKLAMDQVTELEDKVAELLEKEAAELARKEAFNKSLEKAAKALYEGDFITEDKGDSFIKRAQEDPAYLAKVIGKLCEASEVMLVGRPSGVSNKQASTYDPVMARAFGLRDRNNNYELLDD